MKIGRDRLAELVSGKKATKEEITAMAQELLALRDDEAKRDDGTVPVHLEHIGDPKVSGWFAACKARMLRSRLHVGARVTRAGRTYAVVSVDGDRVRVR